MTTTYTQDIEEKKNKERYLKIVFQIGGLLGLSSLVIFHPNYYIKIIAFIIILTVTYLIDPITKLRLLYKRMVSIKYDILSILYVNRFLMLSSVFEKIMNDDIIQELFKSANKNYKSEAGWRFNAFVNGDEYLKWEGIKRWKWIRRFNHGNLLKNIFKFEEFIIKEHAAYINNIVTNDKDKISEDIKYQYNDNFRMTYLCFINLYMMLLSEITDRFKNSYYFQTHSNSIEYKDLRITEFRQINDKILDVERKVLILLYEKRIEIFSNMINEGSNILHDIIDNPNITDRHPKFIDKIESKIDLINEYKTITKEIELFIKYAKTNQGYFHKFAEFKGISNDEIKIKIENFWFKIEKEIKDELNDILDKRDKLLMLEETN